MLPRRLLLAAGLALPFAAAAQGSPAAPVEALVRGLLTAMKAGKARPFAQRAQALTPVIQRAFDLPVILQNSIGPRHAGLPPATRQELLDVFTRFTVASYVANFAAYSGERFEVLPDTRRVGGNEVVQTRLIVPDSEPIRLDYVVRPSGDDWKIVDVLMAGTISQVAVQRSDFRAVLGGGGAGALIASLRGKTARLSAGETE
jgi:phospholipid transport system substrate-binding protein